MDRLDAAQTSETGLLIRRALDMKCALRMGVHVGLEEIRADEFYAMAVIEDEKDKLDRERMNHGPQQ